MRQCRNQTARVQVLGPGRPAYVAREAGRKNSASPISGGSGNDTDFYIAADTCTQTVNFSFTLVNSGSANGYATVQIQIDGQTNWTNRYFVARGSASGRERKHCLVGLQRALL